MMRQKNSNYNYEKSINYFDSSSPISSIPRPTLNRGVTFLDETVSVIIAII